MITGTLREVLQRVANERLEGTVVCRVNGMEKTFVIRDGKAILASSADPKEYLGQFLVNQGHLTEQQMEDAFRTQKETGVYFGRVVVMIELLDQKTLETMLTIKIRESILSALSWADVEATFDSDRILGEDAGIEVEVDIAQLPQEADFRRTAWDSFRQVFPNDNLGLIVKKDGLDQGAHPIDARILQAAQTGLSIQEIIDSLRVLPFMFYSRVFALFRAGVIEPGTVADAAFTDIGGGPATVLVVDDDSSILRLAQTYLAKEGYQVVTAIGADEAMAELEVRDLVPDVALLDYSMPKINGIELAGMLQLRYPDVMTFMVTGGGLVADIADAIEEGVAHGFIEKPWLGSELLALVKSQLRLRARV